MKTKPNLEKVEMFRDDEFSRQFIKSNIGKIIDELAKQFLEPEDAFRELLQNSIDSITQQIDVYYQERPAEREDHVKLDIMFEDYGCGMNYFEREEFFLKLFKSSKEKDKRKIGKYGIGISSVFALGIDEFYVESCAENKKDKRKEAWLLYLKDIKNKPNTIIREIKERKGTKLILTKIMKKDQVEAFKKKAKNKMKYFCKRSRTPIYVEKDFINKEFDIDSSIKSYKSYDGLEFVIAITDSPFYELHNNRLLLEEKQKPLFKKWDNLSVLISSYDFKHNFSRDSIKKNEDYHKIIEFVEKNIKSLFVSALERISDYVQNPIPEFDYKKPEMLIDVGNKSCILRSHASIKRLRQKIALNSIIGTLTKDKAESLRSMIDEFGNQLYEYSAKKLEYDKLHRDSRREIQRCWGFMISYIKELRKEAISQNDNSNLPIVGRFFNAKNYAEKMKALLPQEAYDFKIIPTINSHISLGELVDAFARKDIVLRMSNSNPELEKLLNKQNKLALRYRLSHLDPVYKLMNILGSAESAANKYSIPCRLDDESMVTEREKRFLDGISKMLKKSYKSYVNDVYFTNHTKLDKSKINNIVVLIDQYGKIDLGESKKGLVIKAKQNIMDFWAPESRYDFAINLDSKEVQKMITVYNSRNKHTSNLVFLFLKNHLDNHHPRLESSRWANSILDPVQSCAYISDSRNYIPYSNNIFHNLRGGQK